MALDLLLPAEPIKLQLGTASSSPKSQPLFLASHFRMCQPTTQTVKSA